MRMMEHMVAVVAGVRNEPERRRRELVASMVDNAADAGNKKPCHGSRDVDGAAQQEWASGNREEVAHDHL